MTPHAPQDTKTIDGAQSVVDVVQVLNGLTACVVVAGRDLSIHFRNRTAHDLLAPGTTLDEAFATARFLGRFIGWADEVARVVASGTPHAIECVVPQSGGARPVLLAGRVTPMTSSDSADAMVMIQLDRREASDSVDDQLELTQRLTSLGRIATRVAHELNNPLDGILRYVNLALRTLDQPAPDKLRSYLSQSRTGLLRMVQIIADLLEFSRNTDGEFDDVGINRVIEQAIQSHAATAQRCQVVVAADFHSVDMPSVRGGRLFQVLSNLIKNALDAMPDGGRLTITSGVAEQEVVIQVLDTGPGLPHPPQKLFEPFFTTKPAGAGTGLGLAISRDFVEDMGGSITAANQPGGGAQFTIRLPLARCLVPSRSRRHPRAGGDIASDDTAENSA